MLECLGECFFLKTWADAFAYTLQAKNLTKITLSCTVSEIHALLLSTPKFKMATKNVIIWTSTSLKKCFWSCKRLRLVEMS